MKNPNPLIAVSVIAIIGAVFLLWNVSEKTKENDKVIARETLKMLDIGEDVDAETAQDAFNKGYIKGMRAFRADPSIDIDSLARELGIKPKKKEKTMFNDL
jgi:hypothetical protein